MNTHLHPVFRGILNAAAKPAPTTEGASMRTKWTHLYTNSEGKSLRCIVIPHTSRNGLLRVAVESSVKVPPDHPCRHSDDATTGWACFDSVRKIN